jgi:hypothetical protein
MRVGIETPHQDSSIDKDGPHDNEEKERGTGSLSDLVSPSDDNENSKGKREANQSAGENENSNLGRTICHKKPIALVL